MDKNTKKLQYAAPKLEMTELTAKDVLQSSTVEQRRQVVIDGGDWNGSLLDSIVEDIS